MIQLNDFKRQWQSIGKSVLQAVERVGISGFYVLGTEVIRFEKEIAKFSGFRHAIGVASGQDALEISLRCLGVGSGTKVLTTSLSAFATTLSIIRTGATPVFCDTDEHGLLNLGACDEILSTQREGFSCLLPVNLYGHSIDQEKLEKIKNKHSISVLQDCAQSIGAQWKGEKAGITSDLAATSLYPTKNLGALGDGGVILTQSDAFAGQARALRNYGQSSTYVHDQLGLNSRLDELHAAILADAMLPCLVHWEERRKKIAARYCDEIKNSNIIIPGAPVGSDSVWHLFPILVEAKEREAFRKTLSDRGIQTGIHYPKLISDQKALQQTDNYEIIGLLENAKRFADQEVSLPINPFLYDDEVDQIIAECNRWKKL